jgi:hypothetical protein
MARTLDPAVITELTSSRVQVAFLAKLAFDSGTVRAWSGIGDLVFGGETYLGVGYLGEVSAFAESQAIVANGATLRLSGIPSSMLSVALTDNCQGRAAELRLGVFTAASVLIDAPLLFKARMDAMMIDEGADTSTITLNIESQLADLKRPRVRRFNNADQQELYPGDRAFEYLEALQNAEILWGPQSGAGAGSQPPSIHSPAVGGYASDGGGTGSRGDTGDAPGGESGASGIGGGLGGSNADTA